MGQSYLHALTMQILFACLGAHVPAHRPKMQVVSDMNCYYLAGPPHKKTGSKPNISADVMIVEPYRPLPITQVSYTIDKDGPAPGSPSRYCRQPRRIAGIWMIRSSSTAI